MRIEFTITVPPAILLGLAGLLSALAIGWI